MVPVLNVPEEGEGEGEGEGERERERLLEVKEIFIHFQDLQ